MGPGENYGNLPDPSNSRCSVNLGGGSGFRVYILKSGLGVFPENVGKTGGPFAPRMCPRVALPIGAALFSMRVGANHFKRRVAVRHVIDTDVL